MATADRIHVTLRLDLVPKGSGPKFREWCRRNNCTPLEGSRRAWCPDVESYLRDAIAIGRTSYGSPVLIYMEDIDQSNPLGAQLKAMEGSE